MREILFRGKRKDNGEWIEGSLVRGVFYHDDREMWCIVPVDNVFYPRCEISSYEEIEPWTIGQFTGLFDKDGIAIFEGDIVRCCGEIRSVIYYEEFAEFELSGSDGLSLCCDSQLCKIIGNVYDNPELLEGES